MIKIGQVVARGAAPPTVIARLEAEAGADIEDIVRRLTKVHACHACMVEGQGQWHPASQDGSRMVLEPVRHACANRDVR
jgi:hypothetical protein